MKAGRNLLFVAVLVVLVMCGSAWAVDSDGLVSHWKFDEGSGPIAYDSAADNDGTLVNGPTWTSGKIAGALSFDGINDYVNIKSSSLIGTQPTGAISLWVSSTLSSFSGSQGIYDESKGGTDFRIQRYNNQISFGRYREHIWKELFSPSLTWSSRTWYHAVAVWTSSYMKLYVNGNLVDSNTEIGATDAAITHSWFGRFAQSGYYFNGMIDDVRIYDQALSAEEVQELYQSGLPIMIDVDIKPGSCPNPLNLASRGVLPVAILGSEDFDVTTIDVAPTRLAGAAPVRSSYEDVAAPVPDGNECECTTEGPDGYTDLTLKFESQKIVEQLINSEAELADGQELALTLTGALSDGTPTEGSDCMVVVGKVPRALAAKRADIDGDGIVNILDFSMIAEYWLESCVVEY
ncbi:MAG: LamG-like jellyroll fold domain-containing protein [Planctomycetota bacterium]|jgi:hypothetical protein